jgi:hypothetical protein
MSAAETARRVLDWAAAAEGPPPPGDLLAAERLVRDDEELRGALARLGAMTAARLRVKLEHGEPPRVGLHGLVLAAALGVRQIPELARALIATLPAPDGTWECLVRHGLAEPALSFLPAEMADDVRAVSPLSGLLERPAPGQESIALSWARRLWSEPSLRLAVILALARPAAVPAVRRWRAELLDRFRLDGDEGRRFVLDVYEAAMAYHEQEWIGLVRAARAILLDPLLAAGDERLDDALAVADWWGPLAALDRTHLGELGERRYLGYAYREGLRFHLDSRRLRGIR